MVRVFQRGKLRLSTGFMHSAIGFLEIRTVRHCARCLYDTLLGDTMKAGGRAAIAVPSSIAGGACGLRPAGPKLCYRLPDTSRFPRGQRSDDAALVAIDKDQPVTHRCFDEADCVRFHRTPTVPGHPDDTLRRLRAGTGRRQFGIYGVLSYSVAQRRQEIGIPHRPGASRLNVVAAVVRQACVLAVVGAVRRGRRREIHLSGMHECCWSE